LFFQNKYQNNSRITKEDLIWDCGQREKNAGKPKKNWVDCLKKDCARANIPYGSWKEKAKNRTTWLKSISSLTSLKEK
jgi:hypothetical protein